MPLIARAPSSRPLFGDGTAAERLTYAEAWVDLDRTHQFFRLRRHRRLSQERLASRMGAQQQAVSRLEDDLHSPSLRTLKRAARAMNAVVAVVLVPMEIAETYFSASARARLPLLDDQFDTAQDALQESL